MQECAICPINESLLIIEVPTSLTPDTTSKNGKPSRVVVGYDGRLSSKFTQRADLPLKEPFGLLSFNESDFILRTQNYFQLISRISILFGISFQTPLLIYFLIKREIISRNIFTDNRKEIFVAVLIFSAIITPTGDPVTLFIFTIPLYMLIELVLYLSKTK